jgi:hypothetical protein
MTSPTTHTTAAPTDLDQFIIRNVEEMAFEPSESEAATLLEVLTLPRVTVIRPPEKQLLAVGMRPNDCHANCAAQAANDTEGRSRHVSRWYIHGSDLILHSVVDIGGDWYCLMPQTTSLPYGSSSSPTAISIAAFIRRNGYGRISGWESTSLGIRKYPNVQVQMRDEFMALIAAGVAAVEAQDKVSANWAAELEKHAPIL